MQNPPTEPAPLPTRSRNSIYFILFQFVVIFLSGIAISTYDPNAPWATAGSFEASIGMVLVFLLVFPIVGIGGLIFCVKQIKKKSASFIVYLLLLFSLCFLTVYPAVLMARKVAGLFNYNYTHAGIEQHKKDTETAIKSGQEFMAREDAYTAFLKNRASEMEPLYEKFKAEVDGVHRITAIDSHSGDITLDNGKTYHFMYSSGIFPDPASRDVFFEINDPSKKAVGNEYRFIVDKDTFVKLNQSLFANQADLDNALAQYGSITFYIPVPERIK